MKLRTELTPGRRGGHALGFNDGDREHDAAAAHALMKAIEMLQADWEGYGEPSPSSAVLMADELMREWGFDTGEDA